MRISKEIWKDENLSLVEKIIYVEISSFPYGSVDNPDFINKNLKMNIDKVKRGLNLLKEKKLIRQVPTSYGIRLIPADYYLKPAIIAACIKLEQEILEKERSKV